MSTPRSLGPTRTQRLTHALTQAWNAPPSWKTNPLGQCLALGLRPASWLFAGLVAVRRALYQRGFYKTHRLPVPVIVVGNVMVGGVGKTPITMACLLYTSPSPRD